MSNPKYGTILIDHDGETLMCLGIYVDGLGHEYIQTFSLRWDVVHPDGKTGLRPVIKKLVNRNNRYVIQRDES